jgi:hypothetical protein
LGAHFDKNLTLLFGPQNRDLLRWAKLALNKKNVPSHTTLKKVRQMMQQMGITIYDDDLLMFCVVPFIFVKKL